MRRSRPRIDRCLPDGMAAALEWCLAPHPKGWGRPHGNSFNACAESGYAERAVGDAPPAGAGWVRGGAGPSEIDGRIVVTARWYGITTKGLRALESHRRRRRLTW